jgi:hypothetical protein
MRHRTGRHSLNVEPHRDVGRVEAQQLPPLHERNAPLRDQPTYVPHAHPKVRCDLVDVEQMRQILGEQSMPWISALRP